MHDEVGALPENSEELALLETQAGRNLLNFHITPDRDVVLSSLFRYSVNGLFALEASIRHNIENPNPSFEAIQKQILDEWKKKFESDQRDISLAHSQNLFQLIENKEYQKALKSQQLQKTLEEYQKLANRIHILQFSDSTTWNHVLKAVSLLGQDLLIGIKTPNTIV